jgi:glycosyltransferase involved in cell wall biosynthesis
MAHIMMKSNHMIMSRSVCAIIPTFNHTQKLKNILNTLLNKGIKVIVVDDGSHPKYQKKLKTIIFNHPDIFIVTHNKNQGKGRAVISGLLKAESLGYHRALQVDADGQHCLDDISKFLDLSAEHPNSLISGKPVYDHTIPKGRLWGRSITHFWVYVETLSFKIKDTMCGFRIYPIKNTCDLIRRTSLGKRMDFDIEVMVRLFWKNNDVHFIPTFVSYPNDGQSHFRFFYDNVLIIRLHIRLVFGMLIRCPFWFIRYISALKKK